MKVRTEMRYELGPNDKPLVVLHDHTVSFVVPGYQDGGTQDFTLTLRGSHREIIMELFNALDQLPPE